MKKTRGLILFSGGLDSVLTAKILKEQEIKLLGINFKSCFFNKALVKDIAQEINLPLKRIDFSTKQIKLVKNPEYGYGKNMNPCIDCRVSMLKKTREIMIKEKFDFVATGEVLEQRPMTQNRKIMKLIEERSGLRDLILRPLSAKLLKITIPEERCWVNREDLLDVSGRSRKRQFELADKYKVKNYLTPAGGCLLTDPGFSGRLKKLIKIYPQFRENDIELLKLGRHFLINKTKIIVGRNEKENREIKKIAQKQDILIEMKNYIGPLTLVRGYGKRKISLEALSKAKNLTQYYSLRARNRKNIQFTITQKNG